MGKIVLKDKLEEIVLRHLSYEPQNIKQLYDKVAFISELGFARTVQKLVNKNIAHLTNDCIYVSFEMFIVIKYIFDSGINHETTNVGDIHKKIMKKYNISTTKELVKLGLKFDKPIQKKVK